MSSDIEHPAHYNQYDGFEVIDVCKQLGFVKGNAFKYIARAGYKPVGDRDAEIKDLRKAAFYIQMEIMRVEELKRREEAKALVKQITPKPLVDLKALRKQVEEGRNNTKKYCHTWKDTELSAEYVSSVTGKTIKAFQYTGTNHQSVSSAYAVYSTVPSTEQYIGDLTLTLPHGKLLGVSDGDWIVLGETPGMNKIYSDKGFTEEHVTVEEYRKATGE